MDLKREFFPGIQNFDEQRKPSVLGLDIPEQVARMPFHDPAEVFARERSFGDHAHVAAPVGDSQDSPMEYPAAAVCRRVFRECDRPTRVP